VTGFRKRKQQRRKVANQQLEKKAKQQRVEQRAEVCSVCSVWSVQQLHVCLMNNSAMLLAAAVGAVVHSSSYLVLNCRGLCSTQGALTAAAATAAGFADT
jgi:hypothetical protein